MVYLVNIAAGKTIVPYNASKFKEIYYKINKPKSIISGYLKPITTHISALSQSIFYIFGVGPMLIFSYISKNEKLLDQVMNSQVTKFFNSPKYVYTMSAANILLVILHYMEEILNYKATEYRYLNTKKLHKDISPYISYYKNKYKIEDNPFPTTTKYYKQVDYNTYQLSKWIELTQGVMNIDTVKDLNISNEKDFEFFTKKIDMDTYLNNGIVVGNLSDKNTKVFSPKFFEILKISRNKRAVFYSNFTYNGILLFKDFLDLQKINYLYLDISLTLKEKTNILDKFKKSNIFLLLHPNYTEGITILGAEQMHILEPIQNSAKKEQLIARVVRYHSHHHLLPKERHVDIYQWSSTSINILNKLTVSVKNWLKYNPEVFYSVNIGMFSQNVSPDDIILKNERKSSIIEDNITKLLEKDQQSTEVDCCIKFPSKLQEKQCMDLLNRQC